MWAWEVMLKRKKGKSGVWRLRDLEKKEEEDDEESRTRSKNKNE